MLQEIVTALAGKKNIVPVTDNFMWPDPASLPEDMRAILNFNGIKWVTVYCKHSQSYAVVTGLHKHEIGTAYFYVVNHMAVCRRADFCLDRFRILFTS